jgi:hypothetical protein
MVTEETVACNAWRKPRVYIILFVSVFERSLGVTKFEGFSLLNGWVSLSSFAKASSRQDSGEASSSWRWLFSPGEYHHPMSFLASGEREA